METSEGEEEQAESGAAEAAGHGASFFDSQSATWDDKPSHREMATLAVEALLQRISLPGNASVLEFGCGTGICSALLAPHVGSIVGIDTSEGMVKHFNGKAASLGLQGRMNGLQMFLETPQEQLREVMPQGGFDLVFSHLTLHHVEDVDGMLKVLAACVRKGTGIVAVSDFKHDHHSKQFHPSHIHSEVKHHGICPTKLKSAMEGAGLSKVDVSLPFQYDKETGEGVSMKFEFVLGIGYLL